LEAVAQMKLQSQTETTKFICTSINLQYNAVQCRNGNTVLV